MDSETTHPSTPAARLERSSAEKRLSPHDRLGLLGEEIALLAARIHVAVFHLLELIRTFDELEGGASLGFKSTADWLAWRTGSGLHSAREKVRVARALAVLPATSEALSRGAVSYSKVRAMTRVATPANEVELLEIAKAGTAAHMDRLVRAWRRSEREEEELEELGRKARRYLEVFRTEDGMVEIRGRLDPETAAPILRALEAAEDVVFGETRKRAREAGSSDVEAADEADVPNGGSRSSAAAVPAGTAPASGKLSEKGKSAARSEVPAAQRRADALVRVAEAALAGGLDRGTRGDRYQVVLHVDAAALADPSRPGVSMLDGERVPAGTSRRLACDCATVTMVHGEDGSVLDVGRRTRTIPPAIRRALDHRDGGCRFPGCHSKHCEAHHVEHWANDGETKLGNLLNLCHHHHGVVHEGGFTVELLATGEARFFTPDGRRVEEAPAFPTLHERGLAACWDGVQRMSGRDRAIAIDLEKTIPPWGPRQRGVDLEGAVPYLRGLGGGKAETSPVAELS